MNGEIPLWLPDPQSWATQQEAYRHSGALSLYGEWTIFILLWQLKDFEDEKVERCTECYLSEGKIAEVYGQGAREKCPTCFGTTFEGGFKAKVVRLSLWDMQEEVPQESARGQVLRKTSTVQTTSDFKINVGDYLLRADGTRWQMQSVNASHLRTGFDMPKYPNAPNTDTPVGYNFGSVIQEDESSVAFMIPPEDLSILDVPFSRHPQDWSDEEFLAEGATLNDA